MREGGRTSLLHQILKIGLRKEEVKQEDSIVIQNKCKIARVRGFTVAMFYRYVDTGLS